MTSAAASPDAVSAVAADVAARMFAASRSNPSVVVSLVRMFFCLVGWFSFAIFYGVVYVVVFVLFITTNYYYYLSSICVYVASFFHDTRVLYTQHTPRERCSSRDRWRNEKTEHTYSIPTARYKYYTVVQYYSTSSSPSSNNNKHYYQVLKHSTTTNQPSKTQYTFAHRYYFLLPSQ
jgi:hypothetical protein